MKWKIGVFTIALVSAGAFADQGQCERYLRDRPEAYFETWSDIEDLIDAAKKLRAHRAVTELERIQNFLTEVSVTLKDKLAVADELFANEFPLSARLNPFDQASRPAKAELGRLKFSIETNGRYRYYLRKLIKFVARKTPGETFDYREFDEDLGYPLEGMPAAAPRDSKPIGPTHPANFLLPGVSAPLH